MPFAAVVIGLALVVVILALTPAGRRLVATGVDVLDGSVAVYAIRRTLGLDTTTARQRRIDRRHAREQADILRRIGGPTADDPSAPPARPVAAPTRLVVSGEAPSTVARRRSPRATMLRDGAVVAAGLGLVLVLVAVIGPSPSGAVLGTTATPDRTAAAAAATSAAPVAPTAAPTATPIATTPSSAPTASTPISTPVAVLALAAVKDPTARLAGRTGGGRTVAVTLAWKLAASSGPVDSFRLYQRVDDGAEHVIDTLDGDARSARVQLGIGPTSTFRLEPVGIDGSTGEDVTWAPITASRRQESSGSVRSRGAWRGASGPSLSGGTVRFSRASGATLSFTFNGTDVGWVGTRTPSSGRAQVRLDGKLVDTIDLAAPGVRYRQLLARVHAKGEGPHVLTIRVVGDGRVDVDAFVVLR